jgi:hypothetical protein
MQKLNVKYLIFKELLFSGNEGKYRQELIEISGCKKTMFPQYMTQLRKVYDIRRVKDKYFLEGLCR